MPRLYTLCRWAGRCFLAVVWLWLLGALWYAEWGASPLPQLVALTVCVAFAWLAKRGAHPRRVLWGFLAFVVLVIVAWQFKRPRTDRNWASGMERATDVSHDGDRITLRGMRDFAYRTPDDFDARYVTRTVNLQHLRSVDFLVERFHAMKGPAHTLLTFGFEGGTRIAISVEIRREAGEAFSPIAALFRKYELMYVIGTESDLIGLRTNHRDSRVWLYPVKTTRERMRMLFLDMLRRAADLQTEPEFYNTLSNTCTTNIVDHVLKLIPGRIPADWRILVPGYSFDLAYDVGLIDTVLSPEEAQVRFRIDDRARRGSLDGDFSLRIRAGR